jgi:hypothetical protein
MIQQHTPKLLEHGTDSADSRYKSVNLLFCVIESERGTHSTCYPQTIHQRMSAMVTSTHSDSKTIEQRTHIQMMDIANKE